MHQTSTFLSFFFCIAIGVLAGCQDAPRECVAGQRGCACAPGDACGEGLVCDDDRSVCQAPSTVGLPTIDPAARSCELLLADDTARVTRAHFEPSVQGETVRQAPHTAVTFFATEDRAIGADAVQIELLGEGSFRVARARCFDGEGRPIEGGGLDVDG